MKQMYGGTVGSCLHLKLGPSPVTSLGIVSEMKFIFLALALFKCNIGHPTYAAYNNQHSCTMYHVCHFTSTLYVPFTKFTTQLWLSNNC